MSATFTHTIRPPVAAEGKYSDQNYFGKLNRNTNHCLETDKSRTSMQVMRFASQPEAILRMGIRAGAKTHVNVDISLTADELQTLARALLDAAHALRTVPATSQEEVAA